MRTLTSAAAGEAFDLILVSCKSYDLDSAVAAIAHVAAGNGLVIPLLNGMAHIEVLRQRFGTDRVLGGLCGIFATLSPAGEVMQMMADLPTKVAIIRATDKPELEGEAKPAEGDEMAAAMQAGKAGAAT